MAVSMPKLAMSLTEQRGKGGLFRDETIRETLQPIFQPQTLNALKFASIIGHQDQSFAARMPGDM